MMRIIACNLFKVLLKLQYYGTGNHAETGVSNRSDDILHRLLPRLQYLEVLP